MPESELSSLFSFVFVLPEILMDFQWRLPESVSEIFRTIGRRKAWSRTNKGLNMKILFASSDGIALKTLERVNENFDVVGVLTNKSASSGRKKSVNLIADFARGKNLHLIEVEHLCAQEREMVSETGADFLLSFSFSRIFGPKFLSLFTGGTLNIHPSALPLYRGPSPIQTALMDNITHSAISFQQIALGMDEGGLYKVVPFDIGMDDNFVSLSEKIAILAADSVCDVLQNCLGAPVPQEGEATYTKLFSKDDGKINFDTDAALGIYGKVRAFCVWPRTYCHFNGKNLFLLDAYPYDAEVKTDGIAAGRVFAYDKVSRSFLLQTIEGVLCLRKLMIEGRKPLDAYDFYNGNPDMVGALLS